MLIDRITRPDTRLPKSLAGGHWVGAVMRNANSSIWAGAVMQKTPENTANATIAKATN